MVKIRILVVAQNLNIIAEGNETIFSLNEYILVLGPILGLKETILTIIKP